jgi:transposase-like protein DUF772
MARFVVGDDRSQSTLFPERLDDYLGEDNPVRAVDIFIDELDLAGLGFGGVEPEATGRPAYHPATLLKIYVYRYLNRVQSSRRLERECQRNIELVWLTGRLMPDDSRLPGENDVGFTPMDGHRHPSRSGPKSANNGNHSPHFVIGDRQNVHYRPPNAFEPAKHHDGLRRLTEPVTLLQGSTGFCGQLRSSETPGPPK